MNRLFTLSLIMLLMFSCGKDALDEPATVSSESIRLTKNKNIYDATARTRGNESTSALFEIMEVKRSGNMLKVKVAHAHACQGNFEVVWDGAVMESYPPQVRFFLKFNAVCSTEPHITLMVTADLEIDLSEWITDPENYIVHVSNASSLQDVYDDESVSNQ